MNITIADTQHVCNFFFKVFFILRLTCTFMGWPHVGHMCKSVYQQKFGSLGKTLATCVMLVCAQVSTEVGRVCQTCSRRRG